MVYAPMISYAMGIIMQDEIIAKALRSGGDNFQRGIVKRVVDYNNNYQLFRYADQYSPNRDQQIALLALYLFSEEDKKSLPHMDLSHAILIYDMKHNLNTNFSALEGDIYRNDDGRILINPPSGSGIGCAFVGIIIPLTLSMFI